MKIIFLREGKGDGDYDILRGGNKVKDVARELKSKIKGKTGIITHSLYYLSKQITEETCLKVMKVIEISDDDDLGRIERLGDLETGEIIKKLLYDYLYLETIIFLGDKDSKVRETYYNLQKIINPQVKIHLYETLNKPLEYAILDIEINEEQKKLLEELIIKEKEETERKREEAESFGEDIPL